MHMLISPSNIWATKGTLYTAKYGIPSLLFLAVGLPNAVEASSSRDHAHCSFQTRPRSAGWLPSVPLSLSGNIPLAPSSQLAAPGVRLMALGHHHGYSTMTLGGRCWSHSFPWNCADSTGQHTGHRTLSRYLPLAPSAFLPPISAAVIWRQTILPLPFLDFPHSPLLFLDTGHVLPSSLLPVTPCLTWPVTTSTCHPRFSSPATSPGATCAFHVVSDD